jgi:hypothetical protein
MSGAHARARRSRSWSRGSREERVGRSSSPFRCSRPRTLRRAPPFQGGAPLDRGRLRFAGSFRSVSDSNSRSASPRSSRSCRQGERERGERHEVVWRPATSGGDAVALRRPLAWFRRRDRLAQLAAAHRGGRERQGRAGRLLDVHLTPVTEADRAIERAVRESVASRGRTRACIRTSFPANAPISDALERAL